MSFSVISLGPVATTLAASSVTLLIVVFRPLAQLAPTLLVNWFKGISARIYNHRWGAPYIRWTNSYYVGTAGTVTSETIKRYIEEQKSK